MYELPVAQAVTISAREYSVHHFCEFPQHDPHRSFMHNPVMAPRPFSYAERLQKDLESRCPELLSRNQPITCGKSSYYDLHFTDPNSAIGDFCVHCWNESLDVYWGWDLEHHHFLGCAEDDEGYELVYQHALETVISTMTSELVLLFCSNHKFDFDLRDNLDEMVKELITPERWDTYDEDSGDYWLDSPENLEFIQLTWKRPYDEAARRDCNLIQHWFNLKKFCRRDYG